MNLVAEFNPTKYQGMFSWFSVSDNLLTVGPVNIHMTWIN